ncbi:IucA/IucC family protein [Legionella brunensis]|uniref:FrgA protein n=1 Tax=Legionella brunensis TaxID=29422 RepID=A0A0W0S155_9GAMM|nr:IucA/IucC family protein [Legionella brunensis]KTC76884.1 FrgA protein [Legionella brunensis]
MALAYGNFHELSHQLRFLLFEIGIGLPQRSIEYFIAEAHRECLRRLQHAAINEGLTTSPIISHHVHDFLEQLQTQLKYKQPASRFFSWQSLKQELDETIANEAMAQAYRQWWQLELSRQARHFSNFWDWLCQKNNPEEIMQLLEQWGSLGNPYHPCFRAKIGFSRREVLQYSPEFNAQLSLHWCALHKHHAYMSGIENNYQDLLARQFPKEYQLWQHQLAFKRYDPEQYYPLPIHPWQWRNHIQNQFSQLIDNKELILIPHHQLAKPAMPFNTVMPLKTGSCHFKLALGLSSISASDTGSLTLIDNDRLILYRRIHRLLETHENYQQRLFIVANLAYLSAKMETAPTTATKQLAILLQANPAVKLHQAQQILPLSSLFAPSPLSNKTLLIEIINASGLSPIAYFKNYCQCVLSGQLHLLLRYGVAFAVHQSNTLIAFQDNQPRALILRDIDHLSCGQHPSYEFSFEPDFQSNSKVMTENLAELCNKFVHSNIQSNLAYWISHLSHHYGLNTSELWQLVRIELQQLLAHNSREVDSQLFNFYQHQLFSQPWHHVSLLSMYLCKGSTLLSTAIHNPLT